MTSTTVTNVNPDAEVALSTPNDADAIANALPAMIRRAESGVVRVTGDADQWVYVEEMEGRLDALTGERPTRAFQHLRRQVLVDMSGRAPHVRLSAARVRDVTQFAMAHAQAVAADNAKSTRVTKLAVETARNALDAAWVRFDADAVAELVRRDEQEAAERVERQRKADSHREALEKLAPNMVTLADRFDSLISELGSVVAELRGSHARATGSYRMLRRLDASGRTRLLMNENAIPAAIDEHIARAAGERGFRTSRGDNPLKPQVVSVLKEFLPTEDTPPVPTRRGMVPPVPHEHRVCGGCGETGNAEKPTKIVDGRGFAHAGCVDALPEPKSIGTLVKPNAVDATDAHSVSVDCYVLES